ncbi:hypothetical protein CMO93_05830 [Candidatus Woesearchaeota archaeon]|nr:hypothetical protein [Candidatus Woesearchaeota archaeon]|tara:strand:- start:993 stop:1928 length:936 start_codon:yes stop_codon:yes gene_type:complete
MKTIVTGGAGFIGSCITDYLIQEGFDVKVIDNLSTGNKDRVNPKAEFILADVRTLKEIEPHFKDVDYVFHTAALPRILPSFEDPVLFHEVNVIGTLNCLVASHKNKVKKFVYSASSSCYGNNFKIPTKESDKIEPLNPYALQKYEGELYCKLFAEQFGLSTVSLRYFNVYGPGSFNEKDKYNAYSSVVEIFLTQRNNRKVLTITGDGNQKRDFIHVYDVAKANIAAMKSKTKKFDFFNIAFGKNYSVNYIAELISNKRTYMDPRPGEAKLTLADISKAKKLLNWKPLIDLEKGIEITEEELKNDSMKTANN